MSEDVFVANHAPIGTLRSCCQSLMYLEEHEPGCPLGHRWAEKKPRKRRAERMAREAREREAAE